MERWFVHDFGCLSHSTGNFVLLHDGDGYNPDGDRLQTAAALPRIIDQLKDQGYEFKTLPTE